MDYDQCNALKGLENRTGQNNCFLNVVIQVLWHLLPFRKLFRECEAHNHTVPSTSDGNNKNTCIFCALKMIFAEYEWGEAEILPPTALRQALNDLYLSQNRFKVGQLDDASEALNEVIQHLHVCVTPTPYSDECEPPCFVHQLFGISTVQQTECNLCGTMSEPSLSNSFIIYSYAAELRAEKKKYPHASFDRLLNYTRQSDSRPCSTDGCSKGVSRVHTFLLNEPEILLIGIVWNTDNPPQSEIDDVLDVIDTSVDVNILFDHQRYDDDDKTDFKKTVYSLKGVISYYGKHYNSHCFNDVNSTWSVFDDATVKKVGRTWISVVCKSKLGKFQPSILVYQKVPEVVVPTPVSPPIPEKKSVVVIPKNIPSSPPTSSPSPTSSALPCKPKYKLPSSTTNSRDYSRPSKHVTDMYHSVSKPPSTTAPSTTIPSSTLSSNRSNNKPTGYNIQSSLTITPLAPTNRPATPPNKSTTNATSTDKFSRYLSTVPTQPTSSSRSWLNDQYLPSTSLYHNMNSRPTISVDDEWATEVPVHPRPFLSQANYSAINKSLDQPDMYRKGQ